MNRGLRGPVPRARENALPTPSQPPDRRAEAERALAKLRALDPELAARYEATKDERRKRPR